MNTPHRRTGFQKLSSAQEQAEQKAIRSKKETARHELHKLSPASTAPSGLKRTLRILLPAFLIIAWLFGAAIGGPYFGKVSEVSSNDSSTFLPQTAEATQVQQRLGEFSEGNNIPAIAIVTSPDKITPEQLQNLQNLLKDVAKVDGLGEGTSPFIPSADGLAVQAFLPISADGDIGDTVEAIREILSAGIPDGWNSHVTGPAGLTADLVGAFAGIDGLLLLVALGAVFVILLFVYRSFFLPITVLLTSMSALCVALLSVWWLAKAEIVVLTGQTQGILFILVIGAATDYSLLYTARYREELMRHPSRLDATFAALKGSVEPIVASGGTVIAGLLCLLLSDLGSNKSLGPVAAIGIVFAMLAALTLLPAILYALGRAAYWPKRPRFEPERSDEEQVHTGFYAKIGQLIKRRPRVIWVACTLLLLLGVAFVPQLKADGVPQSDFVLGQSDARDGQLALGEHFPGGSGTPALILVKENTMTDVAAILLKNPGVSSVAVASADSPSGSAQLTEQGIAPVGRPGAETVPSPTVSNGEVLIQATLNDVADGSAAEETVRGLRAELGDTALIGGPTAVAIDTKDTSIHDRNLIIPIILIVILLILIVLLRSILAPVLLILTTVISFGTALGVSALVFNGIFNMSGADPVVPLFGFVFLVALGIDYNIFLMTRVREESLKHGTREGILRGLAITGGVITSAGVVLAATFAALAVLPILFLLQISFIVAFGVLLDTFLVRTLVVPALVYDIGDKVWWPSKKLMHKGAFDTSHS
ncbi:MAG: efflux RND transporter permease subunit [Microbacteriaceae bacterium]